VREPYARIALAGPVSLAGAFIGMAGAAGLSVFAQWPVAAVVVLLPVGLTLWLTSDRRVPQRLGLSAAAALLSTAITAAVVLLLVPLFEIAGVGISGAGVYALMYGPCVVLACGSVMARLRSGAVSLAPWLAAWVAAGALIVWGERLTYVVTDAAGADAMAGSVAVLAAPTIAMAAWIAAVGVAAAATRFGRGAPNKRIERSPHG